MREFFAAKRPEKDNDPEHGKSAVVYELYDKYARIIRGDEDNVQWEIGAPDPAEAMKAGTMVADCIEKIANKTDALSFEEDGWEVTVVRVSPDKTPSLLYEPWTGACGTPGKEVAEITLEQKKARKRDPTITMSYTVLGLFGDLGIVYMGMTRGDTTGRRIIDSEEATEVVNMLESVFDTPNQ